MLRAPTVGNCNCIELASSQTHKTAKSAKSSCAAPIKTHSQPLSWQSHHQCVICNSKTHILWTHMCISVNVFAQNDNIGGCGEHNKSKPLIQLDASLTLKDIMVYIPSSHILPFAMVLCAPPSFKCLCRQGGSACPFTNDSDELTVCLFWVTADVKCSRVHGPEVVSPFVTPPPPKPDSCLIGAPVGHDEKFELRHTVGIQTKKYWSDLNENCILDLLNSNTDIV